MKDTNAAIKYLADNDSVIAKLIQSWGSFTPKPHVNYYKELVSSIISQQLSVKAAATIEKRFVDIFDGIFPSPEMILAADEELIRSAGISWPKIGYIKDLALHILDGRLEMDSLPSLSNEEIIKELVAVKGIGEWTAHMFLIFALGRLDVLPVGDLGIRTGIMNLYGFDHLPTPDEIYTIAESNKWHPYESVASWYVWRSLENS